MAFDLLSSEDKAKVRHAIEEGLRVNREIKTMRTELNETIKKVASDLQIKPALLKRAIKVAEKSNIDAERETVDDLESLLHASGRA